MKNFIQKGEIVTRTAPTGGVTSGTPVIIGAEFLVPIVDAAEGQSFTAVKQGVVRLPAKVGDSWTEGAKVYWNPTNKECEASDTSSNYLIGTAQGNQSGGYVEVVLNGHSLASGGADLDAKANKVANATADDLAALTATGDLADSGIPKTDVARSSDLASTANGKGASLIGIEDAGGFYSGSDVESALQEIADRIRTVQVTVSAGQTSGASAGDPDLANAQPIGIVPSGNQDQFVTNVTVDANGVVTVTLAAAATADNVFTVAVARQ